MTTRTAPALHRPPAARPHAPLGVRLRTRVHRWLDAEGVAQRLAGMLRDHDDFTRAAAMVSVLPRDARGSQYDPQAADLPGHEPRHARDLLREAAA